MRFTVALAALLLLSSCHDSGPVSVNAPEVQALPPGNQPSLPPHPQLTATTTTCTKKSPPSDYWDRPAECVEIWGPTSLAAGSSQNYQCKGWGRTSAQADDWYPVYDGHPRTWWSDNQSILTVGSGSGVQNSVTGVAPGNASVMCQIDQAVGSLEITVTGTRILASMNIFPATATLEVGGTQPLMVHFKDNYGETDKIHPAVDQWSSDNPAVATVTPGAYGGQAATVTAVGSASNYQAGIAHIVARVGNITSSPATITVNPAPFVTSVNVAPTSATISEYAAIKLTATAYDQFGRVMTGRSAIWSTNNQTTVQLSSVSGDPMSVWVQGLHWGPANVYSQVDGVPGNTVPVTVTTESQISGYYVSALSPWGDPFTSAGTYYLTPTTSTPGTPPITYKWVIEYSDGYPTITTGYVAGSYGVSVHSGSYKIYVTVTPKQAYGAGSPTRWTYNVCTGSGSQPLAARSVAGMGGRGLKPNSDGGVIQKVVYGCAGGTN